MDFRETVIGYYHDPHVRQRILDYLGGGSPETVTSRFITADGAEEAYRRPRPRGDLFPCLDQGLEIGRSLWDRHSLVAHLDVEYVNFDFPGEAYVRPERVFDLQRPVERVVAEIFAEYGIRPLHVLSGRGHHFVWKIPQAAQTFRRLAVIGAPVGRFPDDEAPGADGGEPGGPLVAAFGGLALLMEFLAHRIKQLAAPRVPVPVELTEVEVGPGACGRELISLDLSEYADPLWTRATRVPFSVYLKPWQQRDRLGRQVVAALPPMFFLPAGGLPLADAVGAMRDSRASQRLARDASTRIPSQILGTAALLADYRRSALRRFHEWFYSEVPHPAAAWPETYDRFPLAALPPCARLVLQQPNDRLLKPGGMRLVTRALLALGWHPRHIAGLIHSRFARDFGWGGQWDGYDPALRAEVYTRIFAGLFAVGRDDLVNFNCQSSKDERTCPNPSCPDNLARFRESALSRRQYDHLAHRPFNRLFSPAEHL